MSRFPITYVHNIGKCVCENVYVCIHCIFAYLCVKEIDVYQIHSKFSPLEMDRRRLDYLAYTLQQEIKLELQYGSGNHLKQDSPIPKLESLIAQRGNETEQCNMLLLLLLASLEYNLPRDVMKATLETAKLTEIG